jgi:ADP-ribosyl-[dinitrogen reductase] hydrolase
MPTRNQILGCMLGGAVGDALGAPVEFLSLAEIAREFADRGIRDYAPAYGRRGAITDDTQMTLFTAEGLIRAQARLERKGICNPVAVVRHAYLRWLLTHHEEPAQGTDGIGRDGWLFQVPDLWSRRAPGNTCLSALKEPGADFQAGNNSKGCGGVMRVAPVGLVAGNADIAFGLGCATAYVTHGHPSGYLSAGHLAAVINGMVAGLSIQDAISGATVLLKAKEGHDEVLSAVEAALQLAETGAPTAEKVETLGGGWIGEEALAIGLYCALATTSFEDAVVLAVNHGGDSDSTGSIAGQIMGARHGPNAIPERWLKDVELREEITSLAEDLQLMASGRLSTDGAAVWERYPGW